MCVKAFGANGDFDTANQQKNAMSAFAANQLSIMSYELMMGNACALVVRFIATAARFASSFPEEEALGVVTARIERCHIPSEGGRVGLEFVFRIEEAHGTSKVAPSFLVLGRAIEAAFIGPSGFAPVEV